MPSSRIVVEVTAPQEIAGLFSLENALIAKAIHTDFGLPNFLRHQKSQARKLGKEMKE